MTRVIKTDRLGIRQGDCLEIMRKYIRDDSIDAIVTDPPYGLGFMGKDWDTLPPGLEWAKECLRVLKPGGHILAFGGTRTWHRLAVAIEDAGFEMRDSIAWLYGSGFPKSMDVSKAIDKAAGARRETVGFKTTPDGKSYADRRPQNADSDGWDRPWKNDPDAWAAQQMVTAPATDAAKQWAGWGTALKPAFEPVICARKPLAEKTVAANVLAHGTGALNIDATRIGTGNDRTDGGRWPTNVCFDESQAEVLDEQSGILTSGSLTGSKRNTVGGNGLTHGAMVGVVGESYADSGGASRFFYVAKAPAKERPKVEGVAHPTVKPLALMRWLVRLVTPPNGLILDPFLGSGTTAQAALLEGFRCYGIEREETYIPLIKQRLGLVDPEPVEETA